MPGDLDYRDSPSARLCPGKTQAPSPCHESTGLTLVWLQL